MMKRLFLLTFLIIPISGIFAHEKECLKRCSSCDTTPLRIQLREQEKGYLGKEEGGQSTTGETAPKGQIRAEFQGGGFGGFSPALVIFNFKGVNDILSQNKFSTTFSQDHFVFGGGGWVQIKRITIGGFGFGGSQGVASESLAVDADFGAGFFEVGFIPMKMGFFNPRLLLGIGGGSFTFHLKPAKTPPTNFDDLIKNPNFGAKVTKGGFALSPALSLDFSISFIGFSLKAGYIFFPMKSSWEYEGGQKLNIGPDLNLSGPYFQFYLFFGGGR